MTRLLGLSALCAGLVGILATIANPIEVSPPSPVPALTKQVVMVPEIQMVPTTITVTCSEDSFAFVIGVVDGQMYLPEVTDIGPGKFTFSGPVGSYVILGQEDGKRFQQTVVVKQGDEPGPGPEPDPLPPPGARKVTVIHESAQGSPEMALATQRLQEYCDRQKHQYRLIDDDAKNPDGKTPAWLLEYLNMAKNAEPAIGLPFVVVGASLEGGGTKSWIMPFPLDSAKAIALVKKYGG